MKTLLILVCVLASSVELLSQQVLCNGPLTPARRAVNTVRQVDNWTWFTMGGTLYRKHDTNSVAEIWYARKLSTTLREYQGLLLDSNRVAHRMELNSKNSSMPAGNTYMRLDHDGVVWFSDMYGTDASFDGEQWVVHTKYVMKEDESPTTHFEWGENTPFHRERFWTSAETAYRPPLYLLESIPGGPGESKERARNPTAVLTFDVFPNGNIIILTHEGAQIFRPLHANETKRDNAPLRVAAPYPNPATSMVTFALSDDKINKMAIDVRDLTGRLRLQTVEGVSSGTVVDVTGLEEGVYVAVLRCKGATTTTTFCVRR